MTVMFFTVLAALSLFVGAADIIGDVQKNITQSPNICTTILVSDSLIYHGKLVLCYLIMT